MEVASEHSCLHLAQVIVEKLKCITSTTTHNEWHALQIDRFDQINGFWFALAYEATLVTCYVDKQLNRLPSASDETDLFQHILDSLSMDILSMSLHPLNAIELTNGNLDQVYLLLRIIDTLLLVDGDVDPNLMSIDGENSREFDQLEFEPGPSRRRNDQISSLKTRQFLCSPKTQYLRHKFAPSYLRTTTSRYMHIKSPVQRTAKQKSQFYSNRMEKQRHKNPLTQLRYGGVNYRLRCTPEINVAKKRLQNSLDKLKRAYDASNELVEKKTLADQVNLQSNMVIDDAVIRKQRHLNKLREKVKLANEKTDMRSHEINTKKRANDAILSQISSQMRQEDIRAKMKKQAEFEIAQTSSGLVIELAKRVEEEKRKRLRTVGNRIEILENKQKIRNQLARERFDRISKENEIIRTAINERKTEMNSKIKRIFSEQLNNL